MPSKLTRDEFHRYWDSSVRVPGVSEIMQAAGLTYLPGPAGDALCSAIAEGLVDAETYGIPSQIPDEYIRAACRFGTAVHNASDLLDKNNLNKEKLDPMLLPYLNGYRQFKLDYGFELEGSEEYVHNQTYGYGGTLDKRGTAMNHGKRVKAIVDLKVTFKIQPTCDVQVNAYDRAAGGGFWKLILHLRPEFPKGYKVQVAKDIEWPAFLNALSIFNWKRNHKMIKGW